MDDEHAFRRCFVARCSLFVPLLCGCLLGGGSGWARGVFFLVLLMCCAPMAAASLVVMSFLCSLGSYVARCDAFFVLWTRTSLIMIVDSFYNRFSLVFYYNCFY